MSGGLPAAVAATIFWPISVKLTVWYSISTPGFSFLNSAIADFMAATELGSPSALRICRFWADAAPESKATDAAPTCNNFSNLDTAIHIDVSTFQDRLFLADASLLDRAHCQSL